MSIPTVVIYDFNKNKSVNDWRVVDDVVMGGRSTGSFKINDGGNGVFYGSVSLENNGGFSSVRHQTKRLDLSQHSKFVITLRGDGKKYQFRTRASYEDRFSYIGVFNTTGEWQTISIPFDTMYPAFRGRTLDLPNYSGTALVEVAFLIGNKKEQEFMLEIASISAE